MDNLHVDPDFSGNLPEIESRVLAASHDSVYVLDSLLTIRAYNAAYVRFGEANGCPRVEERFGLGCSLVTILPPAVADVYVAAYLATMEAAARWDHDYECSSPAVFRRYHQTAYPLAGGKGLIVANHLVYEMPHIWRPRTTGPRHFDQDGWLMQCACCRKVRDRSHPEKWDWIPGIAETPHPRTSHTYCLNCLNFYYGDVLRNKTPAAT